ncbi:MAG: fatty acyl-AMP ligase [Gammaproteobacteria bacterium]|nr:fatty acyl-AMP ligase [Gammaproteobacteria bacterium]
MNAPNTLLDLALHRADHQAGKTAYSQLSPAGEICRRITYAQLDQDARHLAGHLLHFVAPGSRVILAVPAGIDFITAFFACIYAGMIAVPVYPPFARSQWPRFAAVAGDCRAALICTVQKQLDSLSDACSQTPHLVNVPRMAIDAVDMEEPCAWQYPAIDGHSLAFLQYTSGTTGEPKGVMVSHANILVNQAMITRVFNHTPDSVFVGWLPMYHDMGLIGNVLNPFYVGCEFVTMEPSSFLREPFRWLKAVSDFKAATSGGPNFAYDFCINRISAEEKQQLDLSHWRNAFNGSEKVQHQTLERFSNYFAECGFRKNAFLPCYGLAEATLFVTGKSSRSAVKTLRVDKCALLQNRIVTANNNTNTNESETFVLTGCGEASPDTIRIVNPDTHEVCAPNEIGEIWVTGEHVTQGYWNKEQLNNEVFRARTKSADQRAFLRTGDLGVIISGQLYVTGRIKELIIIRGKNFYPQDIELVAQQSNVSCRLGRGAAFGVEVIKGEYNTEEHMVLVQEIGKQYLRTLDGQAVKCDIQLALRTQLNLEVHDIILVKPATIPLTSSGKTQRQRVKQMYLHHELAGEPRPLSAA